MKKNIFEYENKGWQTVTCKRSLGLSVSLRYFISKSVVKNDKNLTNISKKLQINAMFNSQLTKNTLDSCKPFESFIASSNETAK